MRPSLRLSPAFSAISNSSAATVGRHALEPLLECHTLLSPQRLEQGLAFHSAPSCILNGKDEILLAGVMPGGDRYGGWATTVNKTLGAGTRARAPPTFVSQGLRMIAYERIRN